MRYHVICFVDAKGQPLPKPGRVILSSNEELPAIQGKLRIGPRGFLFDADLDKTWDQDLADWLDTATEVVDRFHACLGQAEAAGDVIPVPAKEPPWSSSNSGGHMIVNRTACRRYIIQCSDRSHRPRPIQYVTEAVYADLDDLAKHRLSQLVADLDPQACTLKVP